MAKKNTDNYKIRKTYRIERPVYEKFSAICKKINKKKSEYIREFVHDVVEKYGGIV